MYTPYTDAAGMVLHINGKGKMGKLEIISFDVKFQAHRPSLSISICRSRHEADFVVLVVSFISSLVRIDVINTIVKFKIIK